ncbi:inactive transglutaminase family protein [Immundisolibacter cernigliae]|uniref:inactive transglutaminase family protein n=1 Tax=Immundisolibacter cernigliae TaxID=1810504 RepID=UPI000A52C8C2|nr:inactive transglutaminase family protein [Immundisolibacter cernigliae]
MLILCLLLVTAGGSLFLYKWLDLGVPIKADNAIGAWTVEARIRFSAQSGKPVKVRFAVPLRPPGFALLDETFVSSGYGLSTAVQDGDREALWAIRRARGEQELYYQAVVYPARDTAQSTGSRPPSVEPPQFSDAQAAVVASLVEQIRAHSADIATFAVETLQRLGARDNSDINLLLTGDDSPQRRAEVAAGILATANIAARPVYGFQLQKEGRRLPLLTRLEVHNGERWLSLDPLSGAQGQPDDFLVWSRGKPPLRDSDGVRHLRLEFSAAENTYEALAAARQRAAERGSLALQFSLLSLPVQMQMVYRVVLTMPLGALIIVLLRNVVGIKAFGTFAPILIALAFRETRLLNGILLFTGIVALGLGARFYMERLKLLLVPRLASVLTVVVLMMAMLSVLTYQLGIGAGLSVALFPMVILTMTIERMSIGWEEAGPREALQQAGGSLLAASLAYLVMTERQVQHLVFMFPELLLIVLAITLAMGRYTGYRLTELRRFKALAG